MSVYTLKFQTQELMNLCSQPIIAGALYSGAQVGTVIATPTVKMKICITAILLNGAAGVTASLADDTAVTPRVILPTITLGATGSLVLLGGTQQTLFEGTVGATVKLTSSGSITCQIWYYECFDVATP